jgi:transposase
MASKTYRPWSPGQIFLLPPCPRDWLPEGHLVYFLLDVIAALDLTAIESKVQAKDPRGARPYSPGMMVGLLIYGYCTGIRSSRKLERAIHEDVAFRVLAGGNLPDHTRISEFRRVHKAEFAGLFLQVLRLCQEAGLVKLGHIAIDGTKIQGNASKHKAMSHERMVEMERRLNQEIEELLAQAEQVDAEEDGRFGPGKQEEDLPAELRRREQRLERILEAKAALEAEALRSRAEELRDQAKRARETAATHEDGTVRKRSAKRAETLEEKARDLDGQDGGSEAKPADELPRHKVRAQTDGTPDGKAQRNFTDPDSRIMETGGTFLQGYNCQAAVDDAHQIIVAADLTNQSPDNGNLVPMLEQVRRNCGRSAATATADSGYWGPTVPEQCDALGCEAFIATERRKHWDRNPTETQGPPPDDADAREAMRWKLRTPEGQEIYSRRKVVVEPVFGQIKEARGIRRFLLRGLDASYAEWQLICLTHNLLKMFRNQAPATA